MKKTYCILFCLLIANCIFSQKIISEHTGDLPSFRHVLKKENGNYVVLGVRGVNKKLAVPIKTSNGMRYNEAISDYYIFELNDKNELINKCSILEENETAHILLNSKDEGFSLIKSQTNEGKGKSTHRFFIEKYNNSFGVDWAKEMIQSEFPAKVNGHKNGDFTLVFGGLTETQEIRHFDSNGDEIWSKTIDDPLMVLNSVLMTSDGEFILLGRKKIWDDDGHSIADYLVMKLNRFGGIVWSKTYGGLGGSDARRGVETSAGDFILGGFTLEKEDEYHDRGVKFGGSTTEEISVFKIDKNGELIWHKSYGGLNKEVFKDILLTDDERIMILAYMKSKSEDLYRGHGSNDVWIVQLDANGELIWEETYGGNGNDYVRHIALDRDNIFTIFGSKETEKKLVSWIFKIDDSFDVSKPEMHLTKRIDKKKESIKNRAKIMNVESIEREEDVDNFLADQIPKKTSFSKEIGLQAGDYLRNLESPQWFTEDFNQDGKLDLLVYGIDEQDTYLLFWVESTADGGYEGVSIFNSYRLDKVFTPKVITKDGKPMIVLETDKNQSPFGNYAKDDKPIVNDSLGNNNEKLKTPKLDTTKWVIIKRDIKIIQPEDDTLVYKYGALINYNEYPRDIKQIKSVEIGFRYHLKSPASLKVYPNRVVEVYSAERWNEEVKLIDTFEISESEQEMIYKVAAEFKPKIGGWRTVWTHSSSVSIKVELETGEILEHSDDLPLRSKTSNKLYQLVQTYYEKAFDSKSRR